LSKALRNPDDVSQEVTYQLTAVIRYNIPYKDLYGKPVVFSSALGDTVSCNTIVGLPSIEGMDMVWNVRPGIMQARGLMGSNNIFSVGIWVAKYGLPDKRSTKVKATSNENPSTTSHTGLGFMRRVVQQHQPSFGGAHGRIIQGHSTPTTSYALNDGDSTFEAAGPNIKGSATTNSTPNPVDWCAL
jgi:hypothetical protein